MKVVILAGGKGTRLAEETVTTPKVMVEIGGQPLLWHIVRHYLYHGFREIFVALGYKADLVRDHFLGRFARGPRLTLDFASGKAEVAAGSSPDRSFLDARIHLVDTGLETATGGRIGRLREELAQGPFMVTYGDGVSDIDLGALRDLHRSHGLTATLSAVLPPPRFGRLLCDGHVVTRFAEKPLLTRDGAASGPAPRAPAEPFGRSASSTPAEWRDRISGGYFVFDPRVFDLIPDDAVSLEADVLPRLAEARQLAAYPHDGFWQCMDTVHEKQLLQDLWATGAAPWKLWTE